MEEPKEMKKIIILHQEFHLKDILRCTLQRICRETSGLVFRDILGIEKEMVTCHQPMSFKDLAISSKLKASNEKKLKASTYVKNETGKK